VTLWYVTRATGVVSLLLLTAAVVLGVLSALRWRTTRWPRFATVDAHRNLTLLSIAFVAVHVVTTVADGYAPIGLVDAVVPFVSPYRPLWLGLGTVAFDLLLALVATSLLRTAVPARLWRALHWTAYASWPVALVHSFGTGSDARTGWLAAIGIGSLAAVALATLARIAFGGGLRRPRIAGAVAAVAVPIGVLAWYQAGPAQTGWAKRSGTPHTILARKAPVSLSLVRSAAEPTSFTTGVSGTIRTSRSDDDDNERAAVEISLRLNGAPHGAARIRLRGVPEDSGVTMTASGVSFVPGTTGTTYTGSIVSLDGTNIGAVVRDTRGDRLDLSFVLSIDTATGEVSGTVSA
jgi:hypothetical protein